MNHPHDRSRPLEGACILLAEAGPNDQRSFCSLLSSAGADVVVAECGPDAIAHFRASGVSGSKFDLVLMDTQMPKHDGRSVTQHLRELGARLPIVALTARAEEGEHSLGEDCDDSFAKSAASEQLIATCARWFEASLRAGSPSLIAQGAEPIAMPEPQSKGPQPASADQGDLEVLRSPMSDDPRLAQILRMFLSNLEPKLDELVELMEAEERDGIAKLAHKLKGTGGSYGFPTISAAARAVEHEVREQGDSEDLRRAVGELTDICRAAIRSEQPAA